MVDAELFAPTTLALASAVLLFAGTVRGAIGFALPPIATPVLFQVYPPKLVIAAMIVPLFAANVQILVQEGVPRGFLRRKPALLVGVTVGTLAGVAGLSVLSPSYLLIGLSVYLVVFLVLTRYRDRIGQVAAGRGATLLAGGATGFLGGTVGIAGPPLVTYLHAIRLQKTTFVAVLAAVFTLIQIVRIPSMYAAGLFGGSELLLGAALVVPTSLGTYVGARLRRYVPQRQFELIVKGLLLALAVKIGLQGFGITLL